MKDNDVAFFVEQYGLSKEIVEASIEDGTLSQRIKDAQKNQVFYKNNDEFEAFKTKHAADVTNRYFTDLVTKAKQGDVPQELYAPIKGAALQQFERETAKKFGVDSYNDANDLIDKIIKSSANGNTDEKLAQQIEELKNRNVELAREKDEAVNTAKSEFNNRLIERDMNELLNTVPFDFSDVKSEEKESRIKKQQTLLRSVFSQEYKLDFDDQQRLVVKKGDEVVKNQNTYDPVNPKDVFVNLAKEYGMKLTSPDTGGQGGQSSGQSKGQYKSVEDFQEQMKSKGIKTTDPKYYEEWNNSGLKNSY